MHISSSVDQWGKTESFNSCGMYIYHRVFINGESRLNVFWEYRYHVFINGQRHYKVA